MAKMKLKTHSGAKKRFKLTKNGKIKRGHAFRSHILTKKTTKHPDQEDHQADPRLPSALLRRQHQRRHPEADAALRLIAAPCDRIIKSLPF